MKMISFLDIVNNIKYVRVIEKKEKQKGPL